MKNILVYNTSFFVQSETFVYNQVKALESENNLTLLAHHLNYKEGFDLKDHTQLVQIDNNVLGIVERVINKLKKVFSKYTMRLPLSSEKKIKDVIRNNKIDVIHAHFGNCAVKILPIAKSMNIPLVVSFHGYDASKLLLDKKYTDQLKLLFEYATFSIVCAPFMFSSLKEFGLTEKKLRVIPYGVNIKEVDSIKPETKKEEFTIIHAGRLTPKKGVPDLVRVFIDLVKRRPELKVRLLIIGDGTDMAEVKSLIKLNPNVQNKIDLLGALPHSELIGKVKSSDLFVLNSRRDSLGDMEGFPNGILEAMTCKVPVISTNHAGIPDVLKNGLNGLLIEEYDNKELMNSILNILDNPSLAESFVEKAYEIIQKDYSLDKMNVSLQRLF